MRTAAGRRDGREGGNLDQRDGRAPIGHVEAEVVLDELSGVEATEALPVLGLLLHGNHSLVKLGPLRLGVGRITA